MADGVKGDHRDGGAVAKILLRRSFWNRRKLSKLEEDWLLDLDEREKRRAREKQTKGENGG